VLTLDPRCVCYVLGGDGSLDTGFDATAREVRLSPDIGSVISQITGKSRMMAMNLLHNPTGSALSYGDLSRIVRIIEERDLLVISNEAYEKSRMMVRVITVWLDFHGHA